MLTHLTLRDFVIVDLLDLPLAGGFTVLSGETGAGKSILIDALALVLGGRGDASVIREGASRTEITAEFVLPVAQHRALHDWLQAQDCLGDQAIENAVDDAVEDLSVLLKRSIDSHGRSRSFINGSAATLTQLREVGEFLVDIHGQHAHQSLMKTDAQRSLLDGHAGLAQQLDTVAQAHRQWKAAQKLCVQAEREAATLALEKDRVDWQLGELDKIAPQADEWQQVQTEHQRLSHAASLLSGAQAALAVLSDDEPNMLSQLDHLISQLAPLTNIDPALQDVMAALEPAQIQLQEASYSLSSYLSKTELDPERLAEVDSRMSALHSAARKFRVAPEDLPQEWQNLQQRSAELAAASNPDALQAAAKAAHEQYLSVAKVLSKQRQQAAKTLAKAVTSAMQELGMAGGRFDIALHDIPAAEGNAYGLEQVEFMVAGHAGTTPRPLAKVASGGELSRISLAIAVITSLASPTPTLIFDEVDSGIGGGTAEVVGKLLRQLGNARQVLCVTHSPQVAAQGQQHYKVRKHSAGSGAQTRTLSRIDILDDKARIDEVARMLGGVEITTTTRKHAKEMLKI